MSGMIGKLTQPRALALICLLSFAGVAAALVAQHGFKVKPCPWCVMQRGIFIIMGLLAGLGWLLQRWRATRVGALALQVPLGLAGLVSAWYQHEVASHMASCDLTFPDRVLNTLGLDELLPKVFMVTASCADAAAYRLLGQPYEVWSGLLFAGLTVLAVLALRSRAINAR